MKSMKNLVLGLLILGSLTGCNQAKSIGIIGGADGPTSIFVTEKNEYSNDAEKYFSKYYVDERKLPMLDMHIENPFVSDDRTLILDDSIENHLELMVYNYYKNIMAGEYQEAKNVIDDESLLMATEAYENNFKEGIYYSQIILDEVELVDKEDLNEITNENKQAMVTLLKDWKAKEFAIVQVEKNIKHNEKTLSMVPQAGDGEVQRYYLLGKKDDTYKMIEVYWEGFMSD